MCIEMKFETEVRFKNKTNTALCRTSFCQISSCSESDTFKVGSWIHPDPDPGSDIRVVCGNLIWEKERNHQPSSAFTTINHPLLSQPSIILCNPHPQPASTTTTLNHPLQNHNPQPSSAKPQPSTILCLVLPTWYSLGSAVARILKYIYI